MKYRDIRVVHVPPSLFYTTVERFEGPETRKKRKTKTKKKKK